MSGVNLSPLGAKNITLCLRNPAFLSGILFELWNKNFPLTYRKRSNFTYKSEKKRLISYPHKDQNNFITAESLTYLYSLLWSNHKFDAKGRYIPSVSKNGKELKFGYVGVLLKLAAYIGPRSGLWNISNDVRSYLRGRDFNLYSNI